MTPSAFQLVSEMNTAFGNPQGDPHNIDWIRTRNQALNIFDECAELMVGLGVTNPEDQAKLKVLIAQIKQHCIDSFEGTPNLDKVRDASRDINVFSDGVEHFMGIDGDRDMQAVITGVMSRFIKDDEDKAATIAAHAAKGVTQVYFEGEYPKMVMKSLVDQPDAPKGKFLKSASYKEPVFYTP